MVHLDEPLDDPVAPSGHTESSPLITPELALVCPETRALAIAMLPERDPDGWIPKREAPFPVERMVWDDTIECRPSVPAGGTGRIESRVGRRVDRGVQDTSVMGFVISQIRATALTGLLVIGSVTALALLLELIRPY